MLLLQLYLNSNSKWDSLKSLLINKRIINAKYIHCVGCSRILVQYQGPAFTN